jgi:hypothetical protein
MAELNNILNSLKEVGGSGLEKTAAAPPPSAEKVSAAEQDLVNALNNAVSSAEKTASSNGGNGKDTSATAELLKVAGDLATADREGLVKEAELFGGAFADGCMSRLAQYDAAVLAGGGEKTASNIAPEDFEKWAQENPEEFQANFEQGYKEAAAELERAHRVEMEKLASTPAGREKIAAFEKSYQETMDEVTKLASTAEGQDTLSSFNQGYTSTMAELEKIASAPDGQEKIAALRAGFAHGSQMVEKLASDYYTQGYNNTVELLRNM